MASRMLMLAVAAIFIGSARSVTYSAVVVDRGERPALSNANPVGKGYSPCKFTFNPGWVQGPEVNGSSFMIVRVSGCPAEFGGSGDHLIMATCYPDGHCDDITKPMILELEGGAEDPRVVFYKGFYYLFYYANGQGDNTLYLRKTDNPKNTSSWEKVAGPLPWHRNGCVILRDSPPHYVMFGEAPPLVGVGLAETDDFTSFKVINNTLFKIYGANHTVAPEITIEAASAVVKLTTGDYFHIYAAATPGWVPNGNYTCGFVVLDKNNPNILKQRSETHFFAPILDYELGDGVYPVQRKRTLFPTSLVPTSKPNVFRVWYGAADANVGTALVEVTVHA